MIVVKIRYGGFDTYVRTLIVCAYVSYTRYPVDTYGEPYAVRMNRIPCNVLRTQRNYHAPAVPNRQAVGGPALLLHWGPATAGELACVLAIEKNEVEK
jgi:hypothetical protein